MIAYKNVFRFHTVDGEWIDFKVYMVESSNVLYVGYPMTGEPMMMVQFRSSGHRYGYLGVRRQKVVAAAHSKSVGKYINEKIKPNHKYVRLGP